MIETDTYRKFVSKVKRGEPVTIGYLGGSISVGASTAPLQGINKDNKPYSYLYNPNEKSWRALTYQWLKSKFETCPGQIRMVNAAIGATHSIFGAYRLGTHLLAGEVPDLLFVEFAVNDNARGKMSLKDPYEKDSIFHSYLSILEQVKEANPDVAIFVPVSTYRMDSDAWKDAKPAFDAAAEATIQAANLFKLPYVNIRDVFYKDSLPEGVDRDRLFDGEDTLGNRVHPSPLGHLAYAAGVIKVLESIFNSYHFDFTDVDMDRNRLSSYPNQPVYVTADTIQTGIKGFTVENTGMNPATPAESEKKVYAAHSTDASFSFKFKGDSAGINFILEKTAGRADVFVDGRKLGVWGANVTEKVDFQAGRGNLLVKGLDPTTVHVFELRPTPTQPLEAGKVFSIQIRGVFINGSYEK